MLRIKTTVTPSGYTDRTIERSAPTTKGGTTYRPDSGYGSDNDRKTWFEKNNVSKSFVAPGHMQLIDNMNRHLFQ